jgi:hypothetical protein
MMAYPAPTVVTEAVIADARRRQRRRRLAIGALLTVALVVALYLLFGPSRSSSPPGSGATHSTRPAARRRAASPVPGVFYDEQTGKPAVVCVGRGHGVARTPTTHDLKHFKQQYEKTHTLPPEPFTLSIHHLPNGKIVGTCNYGLGPNTLANNL